MVRFVKEKIYARSVVNNKPIRETKTAFEKLSQSQIDLIRKTVCTYLLTVTFWNCMKSNDFEIGTYDIS